MTPRFLATLLAICLAPTLAIAMDPTASLTGRVLDADGGSVLQLAAPVTLRNEATGATVIGQLGNDGRYRVQNISPGTYSIELQVEARLYNRFQRTGVVIEAGKALQQDITLPWGMNLGTVGDDPLKQSADLRARTQNVDGPFKRLADGKPDLSGLWINIGDAVTRPPVPLQAWAQKIADELAKIKQDNAGAYCLPQVGVPSLMHYPQRFVQGPDRVVHMIEDMDPGFPPVPHGWQGSPGSRQVESGLVRALHRPLGGGHARGRYGRFQRDHAGLRGAFRSAACRGALHTPQPRPDAGGDVRRGSRGLDRAPASQLDDGSGRRRRDHRVRLRGRL